MYKGIGGVALLIVLAAIFSDASNILYLLVTIMIIAGAVFTFVCISDAFKNPEQGYSPTTQPTKSERQIVRIRSDRKELIEKWVFSIYKRNPSIGVVRWEWIDNWTTDEIRFKTCADGLVYVGRLTFAEKGDEDCFDQPRVTGCVSYLEGTDVKREWDGTELSTVPVSSIQKNIANSLKNDINIRKKLEEAYSSCQDNGFAIIELDDIDLDFSDKRVINEFAKACLKAGGFSSIHMQSNGHQFKVFAEEADPI